jgi:hypothetical protein
MNTYEDLSQRGGGTSEAMAEREGPVAGKIERQTAKIPSDIFLWAAGISVLTSLALEIVGMVRGEHQTVGQKIFGRRIGRRAETSAPLASFVGLWVPSLLLLGLYNKIVKVAGSERAAP